MKRKRAKFKSAEVTVMNVSPGNADHDEGEPITIVTLASNDSGDIFPVMLTKRDTQQLALSLLTSLYTAEDLFAVKVLEDVFPYDDEGHFYWPKDEDFGGFR
jgi:hypothetical protein